MRNRLASRTRGLRLVTWFFLALATWLAGGRRTLPPPATGYLPQRVLLPYLRGWGRGRVYANQILWYTRSGRPVRAVGGGAGISRDASTPAAVTNTTASGTLACTTASFSPPVGGYLVAVVGIGHGAAGTPAVTMSNTGPTLTWTNQTIESTGTGAVWCAIYTAPLPTSSTPGAMTVTATDSTVVGQSMQLYVDVLRGVAAVQPGNKGTPASATSTSLEGAVTPSLTGSWIYAAGTANALEGTITPVNVTTLANYQASAGSTVLAGVSAPTTSLSSANYGWTLGTSILWAWCAVEILPNNWAPGEGVNPVTQRFQAIAARLRSRFGQAPDLTRTAYVPPPQTGPSTIRERYTWPDQAYRARFGAHGVFTAVAAVTPAVPLPSSLRDVRRNPHITPHSSGGRFMPGGISQPPIIPQALHDQRFPLRFRKAAAQQGWLHGISQPPIPPVALRDARRPVRIPPRSNIGGWDLGIYYFPPPPAPPISVHAQRFPVRTRKAVQVSGFEQGISQPLYTPVALRDARRPVRIPPRSNIGTWEKGISQPLYTPVAIRDARRPLRPLIRSITAMWAQGISQPAYVPTSVHAARRPVRIPARGTTIGWNAGTPIPPALPAPASLHNPRRIVKIPPRSNIGYWNMQSPVYPQAQIFFTASGTWTAPLNMPNGPVSVYAWGPGGNGVTPPAHDGGAGGGGGGLGGEPALGGVTPGTTLTITIGAGGSGNPTTVTGGAVTVQGNAGANGLGEFTPGSGGGPSGNTISTSGGDGGNGATTASGFRSGGGGGGSAGAAGDGGTGGTGGTSSAPGGAAGPGNPGGATGGSSNLGAAGNPGNSPGGGGAGGSTTTSGGAGAGGLVLISYPYIPPAYWPVAFQRYPVWATNLIVRWRQRGQSSTAQFTGGEYIPPPPTPPAGGHIFRHWIFKRLGSATQRGGSVISQPPINPVALHDVRRRPVFRGSIAQWALGIPQPIYQPQALRDARRPRLPLVRSVITGWRLGIPQPPIPPQAVHAARRPVRIPPRSNIASWDLGIAQPPIPPVAVRASRRPLRLPPWRSAHVWYPPQPSLPSSVRDVRRPVRIPPLSHLGGWNLGAAQPPIPPISVRDVRTPLRFRRAVVQQGFERGISQPPIPPASIHAQRRPLDIPRRGTVIGWTLGNPIIPPPWPPASSERRRRPPRGVPAIPMTVPEPSKPPESSQSIQARRPFRPPMHPRVGLPPVPVPPAPPKSVHARFRPPWPRRGVTEMAVPGGISQPPIPPVSVRDTRFPLRFRRATVAGWQQGESQPIYPPVAVHAQRFPIRLRRAATQAKIVAPPPTPPEAVGKLRRAPQRRAVLARPWPVPPKTPPTPPSFRGKPPVQFHRPVTRPGPWQPPPPKAPQVVQNPPSWRSWWDRLPKWLRRGVTHVPEIPQAPPLLGSDPPDIAGAYRSRWHAEPLSARWELGPSVHRERDDV